MIAVLDTLGAYVVAGVQLARVASLVVVAAIVACTVVLLARRCQR